MPGAKNRGHAHSSFVWPDASWACGRGLIFNTGMEKPVTHTAGASSAFSVAHFTIMAAFDLEIRANGDLGLLAQSFSYFIYFHGCFRPGDRLAHSVTT